MKLYIYYFAVLLCIGSVHAQTETDKYFSESHMAILCATDYLSIADEEVDERLLEFDANFLINMTSLCDIWSVSSAIKLPTESELSSAACETMLLDSKSEEIYNSFYNYEGNNNLAERYLCFIATNDNDKDNVPDFAVDGCGYFTDNDIDNDNDGVFNWFDSTLNSQSGQSAINDQCLVQDAIPNLLNWNVTRIPGGQVKSKNLKDCNGIDRSLCQLQAELFEKYGILIYERQDEFTLEVATSLSDVIDHIFVTKMKQNPINFECGEINLLKTVSVALYPVREKEIEGIEYCGHNTTILAEAKPNTLELVIYPYNLGEVTPLKLLVLLVHEITHFYQYAMDFNDIEKYELFVTQDVWKTDVYDNYLRDLNWEFETIPVEEFSKRAGVMASVEVDPVLHKSGTYKLVNRTLDEYQNELNIKDSVLKKSFAEAITEDEKLAYSNALALLKSGSIVSENGLYDPWEWHSELAAAYVLQSIESNILNRFKNEHDDSTAERYSNSAKKLIDRLHRTVFTIYDDKYDYRLIDDEVMNYFKFSSQLPISSSSLDYLTCRYVIENDIDIFNRTQLNKPARLDDEALGADEIDMLNADIAPFWEDLCSLY